MNFPMTREALTAVAPSTLQQPAETRPTPPEASALPDVTFSTPPPPPLEGEDKAKQMFVKSRVLSLSTMILNSAKLGKKSHTLYIMRKELLADIAAGLAVNFPDSNVTPNTVSNTITVDWS